MWMLYQIATVLALLSSVPFLLARRWTHYWPTLARRLGRSADPRAEHAVWVHAVSVGEVEVAASFLDCLKQHRPDLDRRPTLLTTVTPTGQARARKSLPAGTRVDYLPFELGFAQRSFLRRNGPGSLVLVEGELWPLLMRNLGRKGIPIIMINGRISDRSFRRLYRIHRWVPRALGPLLDPVRHFGVQAIQDQERLRALDVPEDKITVTGNLKFDANSPAPLPELGALIKQLANRRPIIVAGSTMAGEETMVLDAFETLDDLEPLLILAPRHPERFGQIDRLCRDRGFRTTQRSALTISHSNRDPSQPTDTQILLLDTLGELASTYQWAHATFVGGTLVGTGGHNPIEPARSGAPTCAGPSMENFREIARMFDRANAWQRVSSAPELGSAWRRWIERPEEAKAVSEKALALVEANRGAAARSVELFLAHALPDMGTTVPGKTG